MKSLMSLWKLMLNDLGIRCCTSTDRDYKTCLDRYEHEGLSFLTITLPQFGKDFQKSLDQGVVDSSLFTGFRRSGGLPAFLQGFLRRVFDPSGRILPDPDVTAIFAVRQLCFVFQKIALDCSKERYKKAMLGYVQTEGEIRAKDGGRSFGDTRHLRVSFAMLFGEAIDRISRSLRAGRYDCFMPAHGPGNTADFLVGNQKYKQSSWSLRLERVLPAGEFILPNWRYGSIMESIDFLTPGAELPVRVVSVPKTLKTPRIIAIEPTAMQYAQQAVLSALLDSWSKDPFLQEYITLKDQTPNQRMAREGSISGDLATIDLSEASDRVSNQLVRDLLAPWPDVLELLDACRSRSADVPGHGVLRLAKFASMGSALTFPVEVMVFTSIIFSVLRKRNPSANVQELKAIALRTTRAYGDDLIAPVAIVDELISDLTSFGFKVNTDKTFYNGSFRESCGKDYFRGEDISVSKLTEVLPSSDRDASEVVAMVTFRNQLYKAGLWTTCQWLDKRLKRILRHYPILSPTSSGLGRYSFLAESFTDLWLDSFPVKGRYQRPETTAYTVIAPIPKNRIDGVPALVKVLTTEFNPDKNHLKRSGRPRSISIQPRRVPVI